MPPKPSGAQSRTHNEELEQRVVERTAALEASEQRMRAVLDAAMDAIITTDAAGRIESFNAGAERMFGYTAGEVISQSAGILMSAAYREMFNYYLDRYRETDVPRAISQVRELTARRKDGTEFPVQISVRRVDKCGRVTGIVRDITEQRALQKEIVRIATAEQRRIGQELHDSTQQELTGLGLMAEELHELLQRRPEGPECALAAKIAAGIATANRRVRLLAKGLVPVAIDAEGLMTALDELAMQTESTYGIRCRFECPSPVKVPNDELALHLYRIAQEAVANAVKHAQGDEISIHLTSDGGQIELKIADNGIGIRQQARGSQGLGLRIMAHRCNLLGGTFSVQRQEPGGTAVRCRVPHVPGSR